LYLGLHSGDLNFTGNTVAPLRLTAVAMHVIAAIPHLAAAVSSAADSQQHNPTTHFLWHSVPGSEAGSICEPLTAPRELQVASEFDSCTDSCLNKQRCGSRNISSEFLQAISSTDSPHQSKSCFADPIAQLTAAILKHNTYHAAQKLCTDILVSHSALGNTNQVHQHLRSCFSSFSYYKAFVKLHQPSCSRH
jgi:hypothetical protein